VPPGSDAVVTVSDAGAIAMLNGLVAVVPELSFTCAVNVAVPAVVGVPVILPLAAKVSPAGSAPNVNDHVFPPLPPLAARVC
jgi:hypothetical protein